MPMQAYLDTVNLWTDEHPFTSYFKMFFPGAWPIAIRVQMGLTETWADFLLQRFRDRFVQLAVTPKLNM